jgi:uncharacterized membrane protein SpoIIM required for sporulation
MLEQLYTPRWIEARVHAIFIGFIYSVIGIFCAIIISPSNAGILSFGFVSVLLMPTLNSFLKSEEKIELGEKTLSFKRFYLDHDEVIKSVLFLFLGIFLAYMAVSLLLGDKLAYYFLPMLKVLGLTGLAAGSGDFTRIVVNNLIVFAVCFIISFFFGAGAILFLAWNASVWGIAIAYFIREAISVVNINPFLAFYNNLIPFLPHMITEAFAYVTIAIAGGIVSKAVINEDYKSKTFSRIIRDAFLFMIFGFILVLIAGAIEVYIFPNL